MPETPDINIGKNLFLLSTDADLRSLTEKLLRNGDNLAMTAYAMLAFERGGLKYKTVDDFYSRDQFCDDNARLIKETEELFSSLDSDYEPCINYPRAFTGNIYRFLVFFADMLYISRLCEKLDRSYVKIYLANPDGYSRTFDISLVFSQKGLTFDWLISDPDNKIRILAGRMPDKCSWVNCSRKRYRYVGGNAERTAYLMSRLPLVIRSKVLSLFNASRGGDNGREIFVIQDGYEVDLLKRHMPDFSFTNPLDGLMHGTGSKRVRADIFKPLYHKKALGFAKKWFPGLEGHILNLFKLYHDEVLQYAGSFVREMHETFNRHNPSALFYSVGAHMIHEDIPAYIANQRHIPIFYFQHGGAPHVFYRHPYQKYFEYNDHIKKTVISFSKKEEETRPSLFRALGSMKLYDLYNRSSSPHRRSKKVLYCMAPFNYYGFKLLVCHMPDKELFEVSKDVVDAAKKIGLALDTKVNPAGQTDNYLYSKAIYRKNDYRQGRVLMGFPADRVLKDYGLLILDYVTSALLPASAVLDMPVLLYLKNTSFLDEANRVDLEKRFYLVNDRKDLERYLTLYKDGTLKSKFSKDSIDIYAFPEGGDPAAHISGYIHEKIAGCGRRRTGKPDICTPGPFPKRIEIELASACNLRCTYCPRKHIANLNGFIDSALFKKIVDEISLYPNTVLVLHRRGESLLHPDFIELCEYIKGRFKDVQIATNATLLDDDKAKALIGLVNFVSFSIDIPEVFNKTRIGADYADVEARILNFLKLNKGRVRTQISMVKTGKTPEENTKIFKTIWKGKVDRIRIYEEHSQDGKFGSLARNRGPRRPCVMPFYEMLIYCDGKVGRCNHDWKGTPMGDLNTDTLKDIWDNAVYNKLRDQHKTLKITDDVCMDCDSWYAEEGVQGTGETVE